MAPRADGSRGRPAPVVVAAVAVGGAAGALARYALTLALPTPPPGFPWTVLAINVAGSALLALLPALLVVLPLHGRRRELLAALLGPGVLGGFTTLSAYGEQARALAAAGQVALATAYVVGTLGAALVAVAVVSRVVGPVVGPVIGPVADPVVDRPAEPGAS